MNFFKSSLFSKNKNANDSSAYEFRQANSSAIDPILYTFDNNQFELETLYSDDEDQDDDNQNQSSLRPRQIQRSNVDRGGSIVIVEKPVLPDESIQAFAIRYRVPVSQLRRINNLQNDQEFYALSTCRVPVGRFGILHESTPTGTLIEFDERSTRSIPVTHLTQQNHQAFLNAMDEDLASMRVKMEQCIENSSTAMNLASPQTLTRQRMKPVASKSHEWWNCDQADCGCKLWHLIVILILIILIPFICIYFYLKSQVKKKL